MSQTPEVKSNISERERFGVKAVLAGTGLGFVTFFETFRTALVNPESSPIRANEVYQRLYQRNLPDLSIQFQQDHPFLVNIMQNFGDLWDGYLYSILGYMVFSILDFLQSRITKRSIPERVRVSTAMLITCGGITAVESGLLSSFNHTSDVNDIPAGILGTLTFGAIYKLWNKYFPERTTSPPQ